MEGDIGSGAVRRASYRCWRRGRNEALVLSLWSPQTLEAYSHPHPAQHVFTSQANQTHTHTHMPTRNQPNRCILEGGESQMASQQSREKILFIRVLKAPCEDIQVLLGTLNENVTGLKVGLVSSGGHGNISQTGWLKQQKCISSWSGGSRPRCQHGGVLVRALLLAYRRWPSHCGLTW